jgi:hypothetical protein
VEGGDHEDSSLLIVDLVEEAPVADAVAPGLGSVVLELLDMRPYMGPLAELGIDDLA